MANPIEGAITTVYSQEFYSLWLIPFPEFPHFPKVCHVLSTFLVLYMSDSLMKLKHESQSTIIYMYSTISILKNIISTSKNWLCKKSLVLCFKSLQPKLEHFLKDLNSSWMVWRLPVCSENLTLPLWQRSKLSGVIV